MCCKTSHAHDAVAAVVVFLILAVLEFGTVIGSAHMCTLQTTPCASCHRNSPIWTSWLPWEHTSVCCTASHARQQLYFVYPCCCCCCCSITSIIGFATHMFLLTNNTIYAKHISIYRGCRFGRSLEGGILNPPDSNIKHKPQKLNTSTSSIVGTLLWPKALNIKKHSFLNEIWCYLDTIILKPQQKNTTKPRNTPKPHNPSKTPNSTPTLTLKSTPNPKPKP